MVDIYVLHRSVAVSDLDVCANDMLKREQGLGIINQLKQLLQHLVQDYCKAIRAGETAWRTKLEAIKNAIDDLFVSIGTSVDREWRDL